MAACSTTPVAVSSCTLGRRIIGNRPLLLSSSISIQSTPLWLFSAGAQRLSALLSVAFFRRMEKVNLLRRHSQAKVIGTLATVAGAILMILYKGPIVQFVWSNGQTHNSSIAAETGGDKFLLGTFILLASSIGWSGFYIVQANTLEDYPAELSLTTLICFMGALLSSAVTFIMEGRNAKPWSIGSDVLRPCVLCARDSDEGERPCLRDCFQPLVHITTALLGSIILAVQITMGQIIGAVIIVSGLYSLIWGKSKDYMAQPKEGNENNIALELPNV